MDIPELIGIMVFSISKSMGNLIELFTSKSWIEPALIIAGCSLITMIAIRVFKRVVK